MQYLSLRHTRLPKHSALHSVLLAATFLLLGGTGASAETAVLQPSKLPLEIRINALLGRMTETEKLSLLAMTSGGDPQKLNIPPIERLGIPSLRTTDAPEGVRDGPSTSFPMGIVMASTWNPVLIGQLGAAIGEEAKAKNRQVVYGPCVNIHRTPQSGRGYENYSEDPYLTARLAVGYIEGMQSKGVSACVKHFACNNQETHRHDIDVQVDERTLHEIYLPAFEAAIKEAHVWSIMPAFNQVNGTWMAQNKLLLTDMVKTEWDWDGLVISDWGAVHETAPAVNAGTDIEMPNPDHFNNAALTASLQKGEITQASIDDKVRRILRVLARTGALDPPKPVNTAVVNSPWHQRLSLKVAQQGITLLKNEHSLLPLDRTKFKSIAVIGPNASDTQLGGRWSADVVPFYTVSVLDGIKKKVPVGVNVGYAQGCPRKDPGSADMLREATMLAAKSNIAIVVVGMDKDYEGEELDPPNLYLPGDQDKLIQAVAKVNKNTLVILNNGSPLLMDKWLAQVPALLEPWYAGQDTGTAVADILFGDVNPSGKLPDTLAIRREDYSDWGNYPGNGGSVTYAEGLYVGYRHFDKKNIKPLFPFGFGLSYTTFGYSNLKLEATQGRGQTASVSVTVQNTGKRGGDEIAQLYVRPLAPPLDRPVRELKGFQRVSLQPGQKAVVTFLLDDRAFSYWDVKRHAWQVSPGTYTIEVGASSRDIRVQGITRKL